MSSWNVSERAAHVHDQALVWGGRAGRSPYGALDLSVVGRGIEAGAACLSLNGGYDVGVRWDETLRCAGHFRRWIAHGPDRFTRADRVEAVPRAESEGK